MGLFISDPSLVVLIEVVPCVLEVGVKISWNFLWSKLVGGLESSSGSKFGIILHEEFLTSLVSRWSSSFLGESGVDVIENFIFVSTVVAGWGHVLPDSLSRSGCVVLSEFWRIVRLPSSNFDGIGSCEKSCNGDKF